MIIKAIVFSAIAIGAANFGMHGLPILQRMGYLTTIGQPAQQPAQTWASYCTSSSAPRMIKTNMTRALAKANVMYASSNACHR